MILVVDNHDSFTYNLVQMLRAAGEDVEVVLNDAVPAGEVLALRPRGILLSPGPGGPEQAGICAAVLEAAPELPVLGVCLGHQVLGHLLGARIGPAPELRHGKTSRVRHRGAGPFAGLPQPLTVVRYHSLAVDAATLPPVLEALAWSEDDGCLMGMRHRQRPWWGVQFHPESVLSEGGEALIANFLRFCDRTAATAEAARKMGSV